MKIEIHISLAHLHLLSPLCPINVIFLFSAGLKIYFLFVGLDSPAILFDFLYFFDWTIGKPIFLLPARPVGELVSFLPALRGPLENSPLICWLCPIHWKNYFSFTRSGGGAGRAGCMLWSRSRPEQTFNFHTNRMNIVSSRTHFLRERILCNKS